MAKKRTCDACGKRKKIKGGATCEKGHFLCYSCARIDGLLTTKKRTKCPICETRLR